LPCNWNLSIRKIVSELYQNKVKYFIEEGFCSIMKHYTYPFSAIIGQERMKTALLLNAVDPSIGGVLISGHKGTGKSTAVRSLVQVLPKIDMISDCPYHCRIDHTDTMCDDCIQRLENGESLKCKQSSMPLIELPLSATEDRVVGTLHVEYALKTGQRRYEPGLLAAANRGILYVDEVNLLDDHLVDILLDAAASGINIVEREGISVIHPARFMLIGTMNPEEGELRPQFLDRFGLSVTVTGLSTMEMRQAIVRQRIAFDRNPKGFIEKWAAMENLLREQVEQARKKLPAIQFSNRMVKLAVQLSLELEIQGHRSDIAILKTARALAALLEDDAIVKDHIIEAARYVLPHRMTHIPLATPEMIQEKLQNALSRIFDQAAGTKDEVPHEIMDDNMDFLDDIVTEVPGAAAATNTDILF
jgi:Mg-chelatase subunit ChlI